MNDEPQPIAYTALLPGTPVQSSDGQEFGRVERVLVDDKVDVFDGIVVRVADGTRFVDADLVGQIFTSHVCTTVSAAEVAQLPLTDHDPARRADSDAANGSRGWFSRVFGGGSSAGR